VSSTAPDEAEIGVTRASFTVPTASHWGTYDIEVAEGRIVAARPFDRDPDPSPIGQSLVDGIDHPCRVREPMVRAGYLDRGPDSRARRGLEPFVAVPWDTALDLVAAELERIRSRHGNEAIYAGSYGWASAGRFHHAQSHLRRLMNLFGGHVFHKNSYSLAAAGVILPHVVGEMQQILGQHTPWQMIEAHGRLVVAFGGLALKNAQVNAGGVGRHTAAKALLACRAAGIEFVNVSPLRDDTPDWLDAQWLPVVPNSDTALILALAHTLVAEGLHDRAFLARYCVGFERFERYLRGGDDGQPKSAQWAEPLCGIAADTITALARRMAAGPTLISVSWSLQRADHGEQPFWAAIALAAMLGQIGTEGGGIGFGYNAVHGIGNDATDFSFESVPQGENKVRRFIPVARIADMLLKPGTTIAYDGQTLTFPAIKLVYWVGGNPFHHHQDINRLLQAWRRPDTVIAHDFVWNPLARHADIVLPVTTMLERNDIAAARFDRHVTAMRRAIPPVGAARSDFDIFSGIAKRLGLDAAYTEGRDEMTWLRHLYARSRERYAKRGVELPEFEAFWQEGRIEMPPPASPSVLFGAFRRDPAAAPLGTPSGKIEIFSETIARFGYDDCRGHPTWFEPKEWSRSALAQRYPLHLVSNQPRTRLHSQFDHGASSRDGKIAGREPVRLNPSDAARRGIADGAVVRIYNDRGACLAGAVVSDAVKPGVVQLATGAWYDPVEPATAGTLCAHGNPNVLTRDEPCSKLSDGPSANSTLVEVEPYRGTPPRVRAFEPPEIVRRS
jgi:biotin/methionine sulfoxide reductase